MKRPLCKMNIRTRILRMFLLCMLMASYLPPSHASDETWNLGGHYVFRVDKEHGYVECTMTLYQEEKSGLINKYGKIHTTFYLNNVALFDVNGTVLSFRSSQKGRLVYLNDKNAEVFFDKGEKGIKSYTRNISKGKFDEVGVVRWYYPKEYLNTKKSFRMNGFWERKSASDHSFNYKHDNTLLPYPISSPVVNSVSINEKLKAQICYSTKLSSEILHKVRLTFKPNNKSPRQFNSFALEYVFAKGSNWSDKIYTNYIHTITTDHLNYTVEVDYIKAIVDNWASGAQIHTNFYNGSVNALKEFINYVQEGSVTVEAQDLFKNAAFNGQYYLISSAKDCLAGYPSVRMVVATNNYSKREVILKSAITGCSNFTRSATRFKVYRSEVGANNFKEIGSFSVPASNSSFYQTQLSTYSDTNV